MAMIKQQARHPVSHISRLESEMILTSKLRCGPGDLMLRLG